MDLSVGTSLPEVSLVSVTSPGSYYSVLNATVKVSLIDPHEDSSTIVIMHYGVGYRSLLKPIAVSEQNTGESSGSKINTHWEFIRNVLLTRSGAHSYSCELSLPILSRGNDEALSELDFVFLRIDSQGARWLKGSESPLGYFAADLSAIIPAANRGIPDGDQTLCFPVLPVSDSW